MLSFCTPAKHPVAQIALLIDIDQHDTMAAQREFACNVSGDITLSDATLLVGKWDDDHLRIYSNRPNKHKAGVVIGRLVERSYA
jgi:hypothetical protein